MTIWPGFTPKQLKLLECTSQKTGKNQSEILREALDLYFQRFNSKINIEFPFSKEKRMGLVRSSRTIRADQEQKLKEIAGETGRTLSELAREAVEVRFS